ncbi:hypothetical protein H8959_006967 [Pygathrix nigripes]
MTSRHPRKGQCQLGANACHHRWKQQVYGTCFLQGWRCLCLGLLAISQNTLLLAGRSSILMNAGPKATNCSTCCQPDLLPQPYTRSSPSRDWRVLLHCWSRSPGSEVGKKTAAGRPLVGGSSRKPTAVRRACQPGMPPTLFSTLCWDVYMALRCPFWIRCRDFSTWGEIGAFVSPHWPLEPIPPFTGKCPPVIQGLNSCLPLLRWSPKSLLHELHDKHWDARAQASQTGGSVYSHQPGGNKPAWEGRRSALAVTWAGRASKTLPTGSRNIQEVLEDESTETRRAKVTCPKPHDLEAARVWVTVIGCPSPSVLASTATAACMAPPTVPTPQASGLIPGTSAEAPGGCCPLCASRFAGTWVSQAGLSQGRLRKPVSAVLDMAPVMMSSLPAHIPIAGEAGEQPSVPACACSTWQNQGMAMSMTHPPGTSTWGCQAATSAAVLFAG